MTLRVAAAAYPLHPLASWDAFARKLADWVEDAVGQGAELLVFPEYGAMEVAHLAGPDIAGDLGPSIAAVSDRLPELDALHAELAARHRVHILAASAPAVGATHIAVNRARLFGPDGMIGRQDKQIMTRFERETWGIHPGDPLRLFETALGRIGCLICYDAEFPLLGRALAEAGAQILVVPSCTDTMAGYARVRIAAMARALENQCFVVHSVTVLSAPWCPAVDENHGRAAIFGPPDLGFPDNGILAEGPLDRPGWVCADLDLDRIARVRRDGQVLNHAHWPESAAAAAGLQGNAKFLKG